MTTYLRVAVLFALFSFMPLPGGASTTFVGPRTYSGGAQAPPASSNFPMSAADTCGGRAAFVLVVVNGDAGGHRVSAATVTLNGAIVLDEADLNQRVTHLELPVLLLAQNKLEVQIRSTGTLTISVRKEIETVVYGPRLITLTKGTQSFADTVHMDDPSATFAVTMRSGDAAGAHQVKAASLRVNGTDVATLDARHSLVRATVVLQKDNSIAVDLRGAPDDTATVSIARVVDDGVCSMHVAFSTPINSETITTSDVMANGTVTGPADVAVSVNRFPAQMDLAHRGTPDDPFRWSTLVKTQPGTVTLIAEARDGNDRTATAERVITVSPLPPPAILRATPPAGLAPFTTSFLILPTIKGSTVPPVFDVDFDGDGVFELTGVTELPEPLSHTYSAPGIYRMTLRVHDGVTVRAVVCVITVQAFRDIDKIVQQRWQALKSALGRQDVEAAVQLFIPPAQARFRALFTKLHDRLPSIAATMPASVGSTSVNADTAEYLVLRTENGRPAGHHFSLMRDAHGVWKVTDF
jgi:hypothetical protein